MNKLLFPVLIIVLGLFLYSPVFSLEEISFPDVTYVITEKGEWILKSVYESKLKAQALLELKKENQLSGYATYYGTTSKFQGRKTASGEIFDRNLMTAAMNGIKFGTKVKVTNLANNKSIIVKINDRMGSVKNKIDLSSGAFKKIANLSTGRIKVSIEIIK